MAINYTSLASEITNDPIALGYTGKSDQQQADLLNQPSATRKINVAYIPAADIVAAIVPGEVSLLTQLQWTQVTIILSTEQVKISSSNVQNMLNALFPSGTSPTSNANLIALRQRLASRAEELFGEGITVTHTDVARAFGRF